MLKAIFTPVVCAIALLTGISGFAQQRPAKPGTKEAFAEQMEQEMTIGMVALRDTCKERNPADAARIDANWKIQAADMPPSTEAFIRTGDFKKKLAVRKQEQAEEAKPDAGAKMLQGMCTQMAAPATN